MSTSKTTTPGSTTVKVSTNTGAAKDDIFSGMTEDSGATNLNVLVNDPGSAKIWSLDQNALKALATSQQPQALSAYTLASGASISLNTDGTIRYVGGAALQRLAEGELFNDSFIYTIRMANGALSTATATVAITGVNDVATFGGDTSGTQTEDQSGVSGLLRVTDIDHDQSAMQAASKTGSFGALAINTDGAWNYTRTSDMNYLQAGESVSESFTVQSVDGTPQSLKMTITGVNDAATFAGEKFGTLTEDAAATSGTLLVSDVDHDQSSMQASSKNGAFGALAIDSAGNWIYTRSADMNYLAAGDSVTDSFIVKSLDGTEQAITQTITGVNDVAVFGGVAAGSVQEDGVLSTGGVLTVVDLDHDQSAFAASGNLAGTYGDFSINLDTGAWTYVLRNGAANVQALAGGESVQDKLLVTSVDGTASELVVTISGLNEPVVPPVEPPPVSNPADKWVVNKQNVTKTGGGLQTEVVNGVARIEGFDSNDTLHTTSLDKELVFIELIDADNNGSLESTLLNFSYTQGQDVKHIDVILVGFAGFTEAQLFLDK